MSAFALTDHLTPQGRALVGAIEAPSTIEPSSPFERALARLLLATYKRRLRQMVRAAGLEQINGGVVDAAIPTTRQRAETQLHRR